MTTQKLAHKILNVLENSMSRSFFQQISTILVSKSKLGHILFKLEKKFEIEEKFCFVVDQIAMHFEDTWYTCYNTHLSHFEMHINMIFTRLQHHCILK